MADKPQYESVAALWFGENDNGKYAMVKFEKDIAFKAGDSFFLNENQFKKEDKHPDFVKRVKVEDAAKKAGF